MKKPLNKKVEGIIMEVAEVADYLWQRGWAERNAGNISVNINHLITDDFKYDENDSYFDLSTSYPLLANHYFLVTGTGKRMRDLARQPLKNALLIRLNEQGNGYWILSQKERAHNFLPTSELPTHLAIHQMIHEKGSDQKVVMHTHVSELIAITQIPDFCHADKLNHLIWGMHPETMVFIPDGIGFVPYVIPGSEAIAKETLKALQNHDIVLWEKHGIFAIGGSVFDTFDNIDIVSKSVKIWFMCRSAGFEPQGLDQEKLDALRVLAANF